MLSDTRFSRAFLFLGGAQQDVGERRVGLQDLAHQVCRRIGGADRGVYCRFLEWHQWREHGRVLTNTEWTSPTARIDVAGYSYGGDAAIRLCWLLARHGLRVRNLFLADAVRRIGWILPASLWRWWTLRIPANVSRCEWWRQRNDWRIWGHRVARVGQLQTGIVGHEVTVPRLMHAQMDEHWAFQQAVLRAAADAGHKCKEVCP